MAATIVFTDTAGAATLTPTGLGYLKGFLPDAMDIGPNRATLDGSIYQFAFRTDYTASVEISPVRPADLAVVQRLKRHLMAGNSVTLNTGDGAARSYTCKLAPETTPEISFRDQRLFDYAFRCVLRNTVSSPLHADYTSTGAITITDDVLQLVADLGGNTAVKAVYDVRGGVTVTGSVVDSWADYRGASGYGPTLASTGSARPAWDATNLLISSDDVDDNLSSAPSALFDLSAGKGLIFFGVIPSGASADSAAVGICEANPYTRLLSIGENGAGSRPILGSSRGSTGFIVAATSTALASTTRRMFVVERNATTAFSVEVPSTANVAGVTDAATSGNLVLTVFAVYPGVWQSGATARAVVVLTAPPTGAQKTTLFNWGVARHAIVAA